MKRFIFILNETYYTTSMQSHVQAPHGGFRNQIIYMNKREGIVLNYVVPYCIWNQGKVSDSDVRTASPTHLALFLAVLVPWKQRKKYHQCLCHFWIMMIALIRASYFIRILRAIALSTPSRSWGQIEVTYHWGSAFTIQRTRGKRWMVHAHLPFILLLLDFHLCCLLIRLGYIEKKHQTG